jgi:hypothetical protein
LFSRCLFVLSVPLCSLLCSPSVLPLFSCSLPDLHVCRHFHEDVCVASSPQSPLFCGHHRATQRAPQSRTVAGTNGQVSDANVHAGYMQATYSGTCITRVCTALLVCVLYYTRVCTRVCTCTILVCVHVPWNLFDHRMQLQALACLPEDFTWWH